MNIKNRAVLLPDEKIYCIFSYQNDVMFNDNEIDLLIFYSKEDYLKFYEQCNHEQPFTGCHLKMYYNSERDLYYVRRTKKTEA